MNDRVGSVSPVDREGLIDPHLFVCGSNAPLTQISIAEEDMVALGQQIAGHVTQMHGEWQQLREYYETPEQEQVYALPDPAKTRPWMPGNGWRPQA